MKKSISLMFMFSFLFFIAARGKNARSSNFIFPADSTINIPAPDFKLIDLNGKTVSLSDYKGKILILDFWATWCEPCRKSFPIMKTVIDKYKNDFNIQFLFIDTQETADIDKVKKIITDNDYPFHVAFDRSGPDGTKSSTLVHYKTPGIPTKYVIDSKGIIRFKDLGFDTAKSSKQVADELSAAIEAAKRN